MGRQVNFFLGPADQSELEARLRKVAELIVLHGRSPKPEPRVLEGINFPEDHWTLYVVRPADLACVELREVPAQGYWSVDSFRSPVVEVDRCYYNGKILRRGRLYYMAGFYDQERWVEKPAEFEAWAKRLFAATRKTLTYDKELGAYIGAEASELRLRDVVFKSL